MTTILKDFLIVCVFFCIISTTYAQKGIQTDNVNKPFVLNANEVPVLGGLLNIYGLNFGNDPKVISVFIYDTAASSSNDSHIIECADVKIVLPNSIISCIVFDIGTGRNKHIEVIVNGASNANTDDVNIAFRRSAPTLNSITYDGDSVLRVYGHHFGMNPSVVTVTIDGYEQEVTSVNDSVIICNKRADYQVPSDNITTSAVSVVVDSQQSVTNMTLALESTDLMGYDKADVQQEGSFSILKLSTVQIITIALVPGVAGVVILIGFLVIRKRLAARKPVPSNITVADAEKAESHAVITMSGNLVRDSSMEEIDLTSDTDANRITISMDPSKAAGIKKAGSASPVISSPTIYELNRAVSSSSDSSFSSPYSSNCNTPTFSPCFTPEGPSSPTLEAADSASTAHHHRRSKRGRMSFMGEPISRLGMRSMDSPYFSKENQFDSPNGGGTPRSCELIPDVSSPQQQSSLKDSREINQLHKNPFDSPSVLHSAIQRAAMIRAQQQPTTKQRKHKHSHNMPLSLRRTKAPMGRRASLGAPAHNQGRRSSLGTISLHASALHSSMGIQSMSSTDDEYSNDESLHHQQQQQQEQQQPTPLRASQCIQRIEEVSDE